MTNSKLKSRLYLCCAIILAVGLGAAMLIYVTAGNAQDDTGAYAIENGTVYMIEPGDSKAYKRQLEMYGGKAAVFFDDFNRWFADLWHGKALAKVVAALSVFVSLGIYLFANSLAPDRKSDDQDAADRDKPG